MSNHQTGKCRYQSPYSPGQYVTFAQYAAELMCGRKGRSEGADLPAQFWESSKKWNNYLKFQLMLAHRLLKKYNEQAILIAMKEMPHVFSFQLKAFVERVEAIFLKGVAESKATNIKPAEEASKGRFNRKSRFDNLDG